MNLRTRIALGIAVLAFPVVAVGLVFLSQVGRPATLSGYVEGEALYLASPISGLMTNVNVVRGQRVDTGAPLFSVDARSPTAQRDQALAQVIQMQAQVDVAKANEAQMREAAAAAAASAADARRDAERNVSVYRALPGAVAPEQIDKTKAAAETTRAQYQAALKQVAAASAQVAAAAASLVQAKAAAADSTARLSLITSRAPTAARVEEVFYQAGEWATANQPVVSLLPDAKIKLRFFAPETSVALYQPGRIVRFSCDGCAKNLSATINYVSPRPEYTPPEIYSRQSRQTLVFLVEAEPTSPKGLAPGQPVDVVPLTTGGEAGR